MKYQIVSGNEIEIFGKEDFVPSHILECGQIFSYKKLGEEHFVVLSADKMAEILPSERGYTIKTADAEYFENFFDLKTDYSSIKNRLGKFEILQKPIEFGGGIRILHQNLFETLISFIVSANNNIKRIQLILGRMRENFGTKIEAKGKFALEGEGEFSNKEGGENCFYSFPTRQQLLGATVEDFVALGAGYRAPLLHKVLRQVDEQTLQSWRALPTAELRAKLISLAGVGPKVADCVLLFGYGKKDVFPVDTWIEKMFFKYYTLQQLQAADAKISKSQTSLREQIRHYLTAQFGQLSGYAQQYLFFYMRSGE